MTLRILLDLSLLSRASTARGIRRYASDLSLALHQKADEDADIEVHGIVDTPLLSAPRVTPDIPGLLQEIAARGEGGRGAIWPSQRRLALRRAVSSVSPDVLHSLDADQSPRTDLGCARVVTCHHVDSATSAVEWHGTQADVRSDTRRFSFADRVISISRATAQELIARLDVPRAKIQVVHHGVDLSRWSSEPASGDATRYERLGLSNQSFFLGVGSVDDRKNTEAVLMGLARAQELSGRPHSVLAWAGSLDRAAQAKLKSQAKAAGIAPLLRLLGPVSDEDLAALYRKATALLFVSKREGFGYPLVEAMASGCPIITSNRSAPIEIVEEAAVTVDPDDPGAIADALLLLSDNTREGKRLAQAGLARIGQFGLNEMVRGTLSVYRASLGVGGH